MEIIIGFVLFLFCPCLRFVLTPDYSITGQ